MPHPPMGVALLAAAGGGSCSAALNGARADAPWVPRGGSLEICQADPVVRRRTTVSGQPRARCTSDALGPGVARPIRGVVGIDLDGTLLPDTTVSRLLGAHFGDTQMVDELERAFAAGEIGNDVVAERSARQLRGVSLDDIAEVLRSACWLDGIRPAVESFHESGLEVVLASITWAFAGRIVADHFRLDDACGTEMGVVGGILNGEVLTHCGPSEKAAFAVGRCRLAGLARDRLAALGDSRSDLPLFDAAGLSVAVNGSRLAISVADVSVTTRDLRDVVPIVLAYYASHE